ncbi:MAG: aminoacyl-tRNA hydrolase [Actinomycetota bacterium]
MGDECPWLVVGLGNPDAEYAGTRHNVGAVAVERLAAALGTKLRTSKLRAHLADLRQEGARILLARPRCYMNESGGPVCELVRYFKVPPERLVVLHDDMDLPLGRLQIRRGGGTAGHKGLADIASALGTREFCRIRLGIGRPPGRKDSVDFVLSVFARSEQEAVDVMVETAVQAVRDLVRAGLETAQNSYNALPGEDAKAPPP